MSGRPTKAAPEWATDAGTTLEPSSGRKATGWAASDRPPAKNFNWFWNTASNWIAYLALVQLKNWILGGGAQTSGAVAAITSCPTSSAVPETTIVAVEDGGETIYSLDDGLTWAAGSGGTATLIEDVTSNGSASAPHFVAVGADAGGGAVMESATGATWTDRDPAGTANTLRSVAYDPVGAVFIAVGDNGTILTSPTGVTWTSRTSGTTENLLSVDVQPDGHAKVCGLNGTALRSTDGGVTWQADTTPAAYATHDFGALAFSSGAAVWLAVSQQGSVMSCPEDGSAWSEVVDLTGAFEDNTLANDGGYLWMARKDGVPIYSIDDGLTWSQVPISFSGGVGGEAVAFTRDAFWIAQNNDIYRSLRL